MLGRKKPVSGTKCKQKDIVLVPFPYSDLSGSKRRPVLIISNDEYNQRFQDVLVCVITSNLRKDAYSIELENSDLEVGVLPESSLIKAHKLFTIHQEKIVRKYSVVKDDCFEEVSNKINQLIEK